MATVFNTAIDPTCGEIIFATDDTNTDAFSGRIRKSWHLDLEARLAMSLLDETKSFFDLGANIGAFCLPVAKMTGARCVAAEGLPQNAGLLREAVMKNGLDAVVTPLNIAVADKPGTLTMNGFSAYGRVDPKGEISVPAETIDALAAAYGVPNLIKIDIEGSELSAFKGASEVLTYQPDLIFEANGVHCRRNGYFPQDLLQVLELAGYDCFLIEGTRLARRTSRQLQPGGNCNYLALASSRAIEGFEYADLTKESEADMVGQSISTMGPKYLDFMRQQGKRYGLPAGASERIAERLAPSN